MTQEKQDQVKNHEYDGIQEYDNNLPRWWLFTFFLTIIFAFGYWLYFQTFAVGQKQNDAYDAQLTAFQERYQVAESGAPFDDSAAKQLMADAGAMNDAKTLFVKNCAPCHGVQAQGVIGPNLTDHFWLHGGAASDILHTIRKGVVEKGMLAWEGTLSVKQIQTLVAYLISLEGSNPANAKAAQGQEFHRP